MTSARDTGAELDAGGDMVFADRRDAGRHLAELLTPLRDERPVVLALRGGVPVATEVIVDDGLATGATARAAVRIARARGARRVIVAVPVAPSQTVKELRSDADQVVSLVTPAHFVAVGIWYRDFEQTSDGEVAALLRENLNGFVDRPMWACCPGAISAPAPAPGPRSGPPARPATRSGPWCHEGGDPPLRGPGNPRRGGPTGRRLVRAVATVRAFPGTGLTVGPDGADQLFTR